MLSAQEQHRYARHLILPEIGLEGQQKLKQAKVLVIGAGGLGCPVLQYLTAAGVGSIGIIDFDKVDESNLQRQVLYNAEDVGKYKVEVAKEKLQKQNPYIQLTAINYQLSSKNALDIISQYCC
jgi:molybdopterin/thiamine biosynthesis adenylyltransferase